VSLTNKGQFVVGVKLTTLRPRGILVARLHAVETGEGIVDGARVVLRTARQLVLVLMRMPL
jgi:hypothetical protein